MALPIGPSDWIIFDSNIPRGRIAREADSINIEELQTLRGKHRIAVADAVPVELLWWLQTAPEEMFEHVAPTFEALSQIVDPEFPIAPGPRDLAALAGLVPYSRPEDPCGLSLFSKALWQHLGTIQSRDDVSRDLQYHDSSGCVVIKHFEGPGRVLKPIADTWIGHTIPAAAKRWNYPRLDENDCEGLAQSIRASVARELGLPPGSPALERVEIHVQHVLRSFLNATSMHYKQPQKTTSNQAVDATLLYYLLLPAVVCTADGKLVNSVRSLKAPDRARVMRPQELLAWLRHEHAAGHRSSITSQFSSNDSLAR